VPQAFKTLHALGQYKGHYRVHKSEFATYPDQEVNRCSCSKYTCFPKGLLSLAHEASTSVATAPCLRLHGLCPNCPSIENLTYITVGAHHGFPKIASTLATKLHYASYNKVSSVSGGAFIWDNDVSTRKETIDFERFHSFRLQSALFVPVAIRE
jgi:hypothetical protein